MPATRRFAPFLPQNERRVCEHYRAHARANARRVLRRLRGRLLPTRASQLWRN